MSIRFANWIVLVILPRTKKKETLKVTTGSRAEATTFPAISFSVAFSSSPTALVCQLLFVVLALA